MRLRIISEGFLLVLISSILLSACQNLPLTSFTETNLNYPKAEVVFEVTLPSPVPENTKILFELLDDVTGLAYNPVRLEMTKQDDRTYFLKTPLIVGSLVKYRFLKQGENTTIEYTPQKDQVRFRLTNITGPKVVKDTIAAWVDEPYAGKVGRIRGQITAVSDQSPLPNLLVSAEGLQTITSSDGSFILEGLAPGTHNLTIISLDGSSEIFEQGAVIADEATTPVFVSLTKRETVKVRFEVKLPENIDSTIPLKLATNLYTLGNSYSDPYAGTTNLASNLPQLERNAAGVYSIELALPVETDLRYKYTLGDGFWNGELATSGGFVERQLIVPENNVTIRNIVETFTPPGASPITFNVAVPSDTPVEETVNIQLNPFDWMGPLPMVQVDATNWTYTLYNPQYFFPSFQYRYCRNNSCSAASETDSNGNYRQMTVTNDTQSVNDVVETWKNLSTFANPTTVTTQNGDILPRTDFLSGYELSYSLSVNDIPFLETTFQKMADSGAKWVILDPTWSATWTNPPLLEMVPGVDLLWNDWIEVAQITTQQKLNIGIYPKINYPDTSNTFWANAKKDSGWWQSWFDRYHRFIIHNADLANVSGASAIFIGSPDLNPSMNNGNLKDGSSSGVPSNADDQWRQLIQDIRSRFSGAVVGVIALPSQSDGLPGWLDSVDAIYVQFSPKIDPTLTNSTADLYNYFNNSLDEKLLPVQQELNKPFIIGMSVNSSSESSNGCVDSNGSCDEQRSQNLSSTSLDFDLQARIYNAAIMSAAGREWIKGFISRDYQPVTTVQDASASVRGKPASDVLWYWYRFIGNISK